MNLAMVFQIMAFIVDRGIPAFIQVSQAWAKVDPTMEDFAKLRSMMRRPEDF